MRKAKNSPRVIVPKAKEGIIFRGNCPSQPNPKCSQCREAGCKQHKFVSIIYCPSFSTKPSSPHPLPRREVQESPLETLQTPSRRAGRSESAEPLNSILTPDGELVSPGLTNDAALVVNV